MLGLCDAINCKRKSYGYVETEFIIRKTGLRFLAHVDLCSEHGSLIPIQIRTEGAVSVDNIMGYPSENPLYSKYWKVVSNQQHDA